MISAGKTLRSAAMAILLGLVPGMHAFAQTPSPPGLTAREIIAETQAIAPGGVNDLIAVDIGGIKQWISVRGNNPANPILLFLHGGPGSPMMPESWVFQRPWEDFFTVVQWDQRDAGKTFSAAGRKPYKSMTLDVMQADAEQLIDLLRTRYGKKKIFLMAHSFGSILGVRVAQHRPDALYAYIGVGQVVDVVQNEVVGYRLTLAEAEARGNAKAVSELKALAPYPPASFDDFAALGKLSIERKWDVAFGGMRYGRDTDPETAIRSLSPDYSDYDVESADLGEQNSDAILIHQFKGVSFDGVSSFKCPLFIFAGAADRTTPTVLAEQFFDRVQAPRKKFFKIERASHDVPFDAPGEMLVDLVRDIRPLASGDAAK